jgi:hypothetical protein
MNKTNLFYQIIHNYNFIGWLDERVGAYSKVDGTPSYYLIYYSEAGTADKIVKFENGGMNQTY